MQAGTRACSRAGSRALSLGEGRMSSLIETCAEGCRHGPGHGAADQRTEPARASLARRPAGRQQPTSSVAAKGSGRIDFDQVNKAALAALPSLLARWLPDGRARGREWTARNPTRVDRHLGSFRIPLLLTWPCAGSPILLRDPV